MQAPTLEMQLLVKILRGFIEGHFEAVHQHVHEHEIDWPRFFKQMIDHKLSAITEVAFHLIQIQKTRPGVMKRLQQIRTQKRRRQEVLAGETRRVGNLFVEHGLEFCPYKGRPFAQLFYPNPALRDSIDLDLAVKTDDIPLAAKALLTAGYQEHKNKTDFKRFQKSRAHAIDYSFVRFDSKGQIDSNIELHWQPGHPVLAIPLTFADIWEHRVELQDGNFQLHTFDPIHQALIMILHHGLVDTWGKLRHLLDLHFICRKFSPDQLAEVSTLVEKYGLKKTFKVGQDLLGLLTEKGPRHTAEKPTRLAQRMQSDLLSGHLTANWSKQKRKLWYHLRLRDTWREQLACCNKLLVYSLRGY